MTIYEILEEINQSNSTNYKMEILKKNKDNVTLQLTLKMCYDKVSYSFGVTMKNVELQEPQNTNTLEWGLDQLQRLANREVTGNKAIILVQCILEAMTKENADIIQKILDRDLKINMGRSNINKIIPNLITKPNYMRCDIGKKETIQKHITFPAMVQLKADGTYRECSTISNPSFISRSGEQYSYLEIENLFKNTKEGFYHGEMVVVCDDKILELVLPKLEKSDKKNGTNDALKLIEEYHKNKDQNKEYILPRNIGNGLLNSDENIEDNIIYEVWDYINPNDYVLVSKLKTLKKELQDKVKDIKKAFDNNQITKIEYKELSKKQKEINKQIILENTPKITYKERFNTLKEIIKNINSKQVRVIEHKEVQNIKEAYEFTSKKMKEGLEGSILKDYSMIYEDGTSNKQLKLKLAIEVDVRVIGFIEGKKGTKRENTFGSLVFETDDKKVTGSTSGFTDDLLEEINTNREKYIGKIMTVEANDITKARGSETYALSHPRFIEFRDDKDTTDTLERILELKEMAMELK